MDYSKAYVGDEIIYRGILCASVFTPEKRYTVVEEVEGKPLNFFVLTDSGDKKLCRLGYNFTKVGGT